MFRIPSLALLVLVLFAPSLPAQDPPFEPSYFLIKLDLSQFNFAGKDVNFEKNAIASPEWVYVFFEYIKPRKTRRITPNVDFLHGT